MFIEKNTLTSLKSKKNERSKYVFGFNGKETDSESKLQDYGMRIYYPNLARFLSVDPITKEYPELTLTSPRLQRGLVKYAFATLYTIIIPNIEPKY